MYSMLYNRNSEQKFTSELCSLKEIFQCYFISERRILYLMISVDSDVIIWQTIEMGGRVPTQLIIFLFLIFTSFEPHAYPIR